MWCASTNFRSEYFCAAFGNYEVVYDLRLK